MPPAVKALLDAFDALSETDRHDAAVEILRRIKAADSDLSDQALLEAADRLFLTLDAEEAEAVNAVRQ